MCLGRIGVVSSVWEEGGIRMASVVVAGREERACSMYAPDVAPGTPVVVEMGFVVETLEPGEAAEALRLRRSGEE